MYLNEPNQLDIIRKQLRFKFNSNASSFTVLVAIQFFALLFSFPAGQSISYFGEHSYVAMYEISSTAHISFMIAWAFFIGVKLANQLKWDEAFAFVTTRFTQNLSNLLYMFIVSLFAGFMAILIGPALRLLTHLRYGDIDVLTSTVMEAPHHLLLQFVTAASYIFLLFIIGYTMGSIAQTGKGYGGIFIIIFFGLAFFLTFILGSQVIFQVIIFLFAESFLPFFLMKIIGVCTVLFVISVLVTSHLEVRNS